MVFREEAAPHVLDHVVGVSAGAAGAVATQGAVHVGGEVVGEVGDLEAALQARLSAQDAPAGNNDIVTIVTTSGSGVVTSSGTEENLRTRQLGELCGRAWRISHPGLPTLPTCSSQECAIKSG